MAAIDQYIERIPNTELQEQIREEVDRLTKKKRFGLVYENHLPDNVLMPEVTIRRGTKVALRGNTPNDVYEVQDIEKDNAVCRNLASLEDKTFLLDDLVAVAQRGDVIYPYLKPMDSVENAPDSDLWHTLIEADNYHALQTLAYLYPGMVDCIYIDPPYNKPDSHDWKYNCDYVDGTDAYRHSKWLSMMEARLKIAKKLLNPNDSVLIVTIDELEYHHLGCLLEQMFPEARIQMVSTLVNPKGVTRNGFRRADEYIYVVMIGTASPCPLDLGIEWSPSAIKSKHEGKNNIAMLGWTSMMRRGSHSSRQERMGLYYAIYVDPVSKNIKKIGKSLPQGVDKDTDCLGLIQVLPLRANGSQGCWQVGPQELQSRISQGRIKVGKETSYGFVINYLPNGEYNKVISGEFEIIGYSNNNNSIVTLKKECDDDSLSIAPTQWKIALHDASAYGSTLIRNIFNDKRFEFPKSLYAVHDTIRFFVANKPNALILDFFAGSGTTLHAVNLLNKEDGGHRRCIMVTNNEIGEPKEKELRPQGIRPGDEEWEKWGIARYVNWPRTKCSILGEDVNGKPIEGDYITSLTETKLTDRKFTQINFLPVDATKKQKKALVTLINKQKDVKLPTMSDDVPFLVSEDDSYNASILFDVNEAEAWMEALDGNSHITRFYIVAEKDADFKRIKAEVSEVMGQIEETIPVKMPMSEGFKANAAFFKLGFLDKRSVARGRQLQELLPLLWMKAGAIGKCPKRITDDYAILPNNRMAILTDEAFFVRFKEDISQHPEIKVVYLITDSQNAYLAMTNELKGMKTFQLYRDYLDNFRINYATK